MIWKRRRKKKKVLFVCTHNSARSQMAEALLNAFHGDRYIAYSAGTEPSRINPHATQVIYELGVDISTTHRSKNIEEFLGKKLDYVVTVCDHARETCPVFRGGEHIHESFEDPSAFQGTEEEKLSAFRRIRDEIKTWIEREFGKDET